MYKKAKYNFLIIFLMIIIGLIAGTSNGALLSAPSTDDPSFDIPDEQVVEEEVTPDNSQFTMPGTDAGAMERIAFSIKVIDEGYGFTSQFSQEVLAMGQSQKIVSLQYRGEGYDLSEEWHYADFALGQNQFLSYYSDGTNMKYKKITNRSNFSYADKTYNYTKADEEENLPVAQYTQNYGTLNDVPLTFNASTCSLNKYDKRSDANYYIIVVRYDTKKIDQTYVNLFEANGAKNVSFTSVLYTFKISKKTGYLARVEKEEIFNTTYAGISVSCTARMVQVYTTMNKSAKTQIQSIYAKSFV